MTACILIMLLVAFVAAKLFRSTKMWWTLMSAIMFGLLIGIMSKEAVNKQKLFTADTQVVSTVVDEDCSDMQSLVSTVTEGTTIAYLGLQVIAEQSSDTLTDALSILYQSNGRNPPDYLDSG